MGISKTKIGQNFFILFTIMLFVLLPVYSSNAMAVQINDLQASGTAGVSGIRGEVDRSVISFGVTDATTFGSANIIGVTNADFDCTPQGAPTQNCQYSFPNDYARYSKIDYVIQVLSTSGVQLIVPQVTSLIVDNQEPIINSLELITVGTTLTAQVSITDTANKESESCGGISSVKILNQDTTVGTTNVKNNSCDLLVDVPLTFKVTTAREYSFCIEAKDNLNQTGERCFLKYLDTKKPVLKEFSINSKSGAEIKATAGKMIELGSLSLTVEEEGELSGTVDLIGFDDRAGVETLYKNLKIKCSITDDIKKECAVSLAGKFIISSTPDLSILFNLTDGSGNSLVVTKKYELVLDTTGPVFKSLYTPFVDDQDTIWIGENSTEIIAVFEDAGIGLGNKNVILDVSELGGQTATTNSGLNFGSGNTNSGVNFLIPNTCELEGSLWLCTWKYIVASVEDGVQGRVNFKQILDDAGNLALNHPTIPIQVDKSEPELIHLEVLLSGETDFDLTDEDADEEIYHAGAGDELEINAYIEDYTLVQAYADLTEIIYDAQQDPVAFENLEAECIPFEVETEEDIIVMAEINNHRSYDSSKRIFKCSWITPTILTGYHSKEQMLFTIKDMFDNTAEEKKYLKIYGRLNESEMLEEQFWTIDTESFSGNFNNYLHPKTGLDRYMWTLGSQTIFQQFDLIPKSGSPKILDVQFYVTDYYPGLEYFLMNEETDDPNQVMEMGILGYDIGETERHDVIYLKTNPAQAPGMNEEIDTGETKENADGTISAVTENETITELNVLTQIGVASIVKLGNEEFITNWEIHNVTITVPLYNNPMGQNLDNVQKKIDEITDIVDSGWAWMTKVRIVLSYAEKICGILGTLKSIYKSILQIGEIFKTIGLGMSPYGKGLEQAGSEGVKEATELEGVFSTGTLEQGYSILCGLLIQCKISERDKNKANNEDTCNGDSDTWCKVKQVWVKINTGYASLANDKLKMTVPIKEYETFDETSFDPKDSMFSSLATLCLPGIILNIEKVRQIYCKQLLCLKTKVPYGTPIAKCQKEFQYSICTFWWGQAFMAIPIFQYMEDLSSTIQDIIAHPEYVLPGLVVDHSLQIMCMDDISPPGACTAAHLIKWGAGFASNILGVVNMFDKNGWNLKQDYCEEALKDNPDNTKV